MTRDKIPTNDYPATFFGSAVLGIIIGAALGVWFAPKSGRQALREAWDFAEVKREEVQEFLQKWQGESMQDAFNQGRHIAHRHRAHTAKRLPQK